MNPRKTCEYNINMVKWCWSCA